MTDDNKTIKDEDLFLAELEAFRTGEDYDLSAYEESILPGKDRGLDDLAQISDLFSSTRPDPGEISGAADDIVLSHIKEKSREIRRERKVIRLFPRHKWAAAAVMGVLVCIFSYNLFFKMDKPAGTITPVPAKASYSINEKKNAIVTKAQPLKTALVTSDTAAGKSGLKEIGAKKPVNNNSGDSAENLSMQAAGDIDGNGRINIIDAYIMDRKLISGNDMPKKLDLNGDGSINREDIDTIVKISVSLGRGDV